MPKRWQMSSNFGKNRSEYQQKGMSGRAEDAAARYGLTMSDLQEHKVPCQWRSCYGNSYAVVKFSDVSALATKLKAIEAAEEEERLLKLHGVEGLAKIREAAAAAKKVEEEKAALAEKKKQSVRQLTDILTEIAELSSGPHVDITNNKTESEMMQLRLGKTAAKADFHLNAAAMSSLSNKGVRVGKRIMFDVEDVVKAARACHSRTRTTYTNPYVPHHEIKNNMEGYFFVLRRIASRFAKKMDPESVDQAHEAVRLKLESKTALALARMVAAQSEHVAAVARTVAFGNNAWMHPAALARMESAEKEHASSSSASSSSSSSSSGTKRKNYGGRAPRKQLATKAARKATGGKAPRKQLATRAARTPVASAKSNKKSKKNDATSNTLVPA
jgi:hypothetical protein